MSSPNDSELLSFSEIGKYSKICFSVPYVVKSVGWKTRMLATSGWSRGVLDSQLSYHTCCINALEINLTTVQQILKFSMFSKLEHVGSVAFVRLYSLHFQRTCANNHTSRKH